MDFQYQAGGLHLPGLGLWLDAPRPVKGEDRVVITHAHSDHAALHREVVCTHPTRRFLKARLGSIPVAHEQAYHEVREYTGPGGSYRITLLPAGHILGSAMVLVEADGATLLYTGDFKLRAGKSCEPCRPCHADVLVMETTFGRPEYQFPPASNVIQSIVRFCRDALDNEETPVLQGYALGKSQELLCCLREEGMPLVVHPQVHKLAAIYAELGCQFPAYDLWDLSTPAGKVLIVPPGVAATRGLAGSRSAFVTGWAMDPNFRFRSRCDAAFPLSDHADFPELLEMVQLVSPRRVCTLHGFAADFAEVLRSKGYDARALSQEDQLGLHLEVSEVPAVAPVLSHPAKTGATEQVGAPLASQMDHLVPGTFQQFAWVCAQIQDTRKKTEKTKVLVGFLRTLAGLDLGTVVSWLCSVSSAEGTARKPQIGWGFLRDTLCPLAGVKDQELREVFLRQGDTAETVHELLAAKGTPSTGVKMCEVAEAVAELGAGRKSAASLARWRKLLERSSAFEGKWMTKLLDGGIRVGLTPGGVEEALAEAFGSKIEEVRRAARLVGDMAEVAVLVSERRLSEAGPQPFRPIRFMMAARARDARSAFEKIRGSGTRAASGTQSEFFVPASPEAGTWVEPAYVGLRCQVHKAGGQARLYSMDQNEVTMAFPEIIQAASGTEGEFILDGAIVAMRGEEFLPLQVLEVHLGKRERDLFPDAEVDFHFVAFDLYWAGGAALVSEPLWERRRRLESLRLPGNFFRISRVTHAGRATDADLALQDAARAGHKGIILKDPQSEYQPGRRSSAWVALSVGTVRFDERSRLC